MTGQSIWQEQGKMSRNESGTYQSKAVYIHCAGHSLNLAVASSSSIPTICDCIEISLSGRHLLPREKPLDNSSDIHLTTRNPTSKLSQDGSKTLMDGRDSVYVTPFMLQIRCVKSLFMATKMDGMLTIRKMY